MTGQRVSANNLPARSDPTGISANNIEFARFILDKNVIGITAEPYRESWGTELINSEILLPLSSGGEVNDNVLYAGRVIRPEDDPDDPPAGLGVA